MIAVVALRELFVHTCALTERVSAGSSTTLVSSQATNKFHSLFSFGVDVPGIQGIVVAFRAVDIAPQRRYDLSTSQPSE